MKLRVALLICLLFRWRVHAAPLIETENLSPKCSQLLQHLVAVITELIKDQKHGCYEVDEPSKPLPLEDVAVAVPALTTERTPVTIAIADVKEEERPGIAPSLPETTTLVVEAETTTKKTSTPQAEITSAPQIEITSIPQTEITSTPQVEITSSPQAEVTSIPQTETTSTSEVPKVEATTVVTEDEINTTSKEETTIETTTSSSPEATTSSEVGNESKEELTTSSPEIKTTPAPSPPSLPITTTATESENPDVTTEPPAPVAPVNSCEDQDAGVAPEPYSGLPKVCEKPAGCLPMDSFCGNLNDLYVPVFRFDGYPQQAQVQFVFKA